MMEFEHVTTEAAVATHDASSEIFCWYIVRNERVIEEETGYDFEQA